MARRLVVLALVGLAAVCLASAQQTEQEKRLTNADIISMVKAGLSESNIILAVESGSASFDTSAKALVELTQAGVPQNVIAAMLRSGRGGTSRSKRRGGSAPAPEPPPKIVLRVGEQEVTTNELSGFFGLCLEEPIQRTVAALDFKPLVEQYALILVLAQQAVRDHLEPDPSLVRIRTVDLVRSNFPGVLRNEQLALAEFAHLWGQTQADPQEVREFYSRSGAATWLIYEAGKEAVLPTLAEFYPGFELAVRREKFVRAVADLRGRAKIWIDEKGPYVLGFGDSHFAPIRTKPEAKAAGYDYWPFIWEPPPWWSPEDNLLAAQAPVNRNPSVPLGQDAVDQIRAGPHQAMPPAQATPSALGGMSGVSVTNATKYQLFVYLKGPVSQTLEIAPNQSQNLTLPPGHYEVAAKVSNPSVIPFYGTDDYGADTMSSYQFYIQYQTH